MQIIPALTAQRAHTKGFGAAWQSLNAGRLGWCAVLLSSSASCTCIESNLTERASRSTRALSSSARIWSLSPEALSRPWPTK
jgi:hypothetical protein